MEQMTEVMNEQAAPIAVETTPAVEATTPVEATKVDFIETLAEDLKTSKSLEKFKGKDVNELAKSYINLEKLVGAKQPTAPEKYVLPEEATNVINEQILEVAKKSNITQDQLKALADKLVEAKRAELVQLESEVGAKLAANKKELELEFGVNLDKRLEAVKAVMTQYGSEDLAESLKDTGALHNAKFIKFLDKISQEVLQVKMVGSDYNAQYVPTASEAKALIAKKYADPEFTKAYFNPFDANHKKAVEEMVKLSELSSNA